MMSRQITQIDPKKTRSQSPGPNTTSPFDARTYRLTSGRSDCRCHRNCKPWALAERQGFEPWVDLRPQRLSRPPYSTALAPLQPITDPTPPTHQNTGGGRGSRTPMSLRSADFKSAALPVRTSPPELEIKYKKSQTPCQLENAPSEWTPRAVPIDGPPS